MALLKRNRCIKSIDKILETVCFYRPVCPFKKLGRPSCAVLLHSDTKEGIEMPMSIVGVNTSMNVASENERNIGRQARSISAVLL